MIAGHAQGGEEKAATAKKEMRWSVLNVLRVTIETIIVARTAGTPEQRRARLA